MSPVIAPSITIGAVILSWRRAATKVIVSPDPSGTVPITLTPFGARPLSRTRFVLTAVSSINTSRAGSRKPCSRIQRRRARATSARCRSAACRVFFKGDVVAIEKTPERAAAGSNPLLAQLCNGLLKRQVWMLSNHSQDLGRKLFKRRNASAARLRRGAVIIAPALQPLDRRGYAHLKTFGRLAPRCARNHGFDNAYPQVTRIGLWHCPPPTVRRINAQKTPSSLTVWESPDSNRAKTALVYLPVAVCALVIATTNFSRAQQPPAVDQKASGADVV